MYIYRQRTRFVKSYLSWGHFPHDARLPGFVDCWSGQRLPSQNAWRSWRRRRGRLAGMSFQVPRETPMLLGHIIFVWCSGASTSKTLNRKFHENSIHESSTTCHEASSLTCIIDVSMMLHFMQGSLPSLRLKRGLVTQRAWVNSALHRPWGLPAICRWHHWDPRMKSWWGLQSNCRLWK